MKTLLTFMVVLLAGDALGGGAQAGASTRFTPACAGTPWYWCEMMWTTNDGSGRIAGCVDLSGSGHPLIGGGTTANPLWSNNAANGRPCARFTSTSSQVFTNTALAVTLNAANLYGVYVGKAATSGANYEAYTAAGTTTNNQFACDAASAHIGSFDGSSSTATTAVNMSTAFTQIDAVLIIQGGATNGSVQSVFTNGVVAPQNDLQALTRSVNFGSYGRILTIYGDQLTCGMSLWGYLPPTSQRNLVSEYWHSQYKCWQ